MVRGALKVCNIFLSLSISFNLISLHLVIGFDLFFCLLLKEFNALLTCSNARQGEFPAQGAQMGYHGLAEIAGWGVWRNINLNMFSFLVAGQDVSCFPLWMHLSHHNWKIANLFQVVDSILIADRKTKYYQGIMINMDEWDAVDTLCQVFKLSTPQSIFTFFNEYYQSCDFFLFISFLSFN